MNNLAANFPELTPCISAALSANGHADISASLTQLEIERTTYDPDANAGYIYITPRKFVQIISISSSAKKVSKTIEVESELWINVDIGLEGDLLGIEILSPTKGITEKLVRLR